MAIDPIPVGYPMRSIFAISPAVAAVWRFGVCKKGSSPAPAKIKVFEAATPKVKQVWQAALDADRANDYGKGLRLYCSLLRENLTEAQHDAVGRLSTGLKQRLSDAPENGAPMSRKLRIEYRGAMYHVMNRGDQREDICRSCWGSWRKECGVRTSNAYRPGHSNKLNI
jgi:hypothetical protein